MSLFCHYSRDPWYLVSVCLRRQGRDPDCFRRLLEPGLQPESRPSGKTNRRPLPLESLVRALPYLSADPGTLEKLDDAYDGRLLPELETAERVAGPVPFAPLRMLRRFSLRQDRLDDYLLRNDCEIYSGSSGGRGLCLIFVEPGSVSPELFPGTRLWLDPQRPLCSGQTVLAAARDGSYVLRILKLLPEGKVLVPAAGNSRLPAMGPETVRHRVRWMLPVSAVEICLMT